MRYRVGRKVDCDYIDADSMIVHPSGALMFYDVAASDRDKPFRIATVLVRFYAPHAWVRVDPA